MVHALPSIQLRNVVNNLAVINPYNNKIIKLKTRPTYENTPIEEYILFKERRDMGDSYNDLFTKNVLVDGSILNKLFADDAFKKHTLLD